MNKKITSVLTIAGSDSSGGAGIQADIKTISALGCYAASVITALTAQNTQNVQSIFPISQQFVADQLDAVFKDMTFSAVKIGMLFQSDIIECVAEKLKQWKVKNIVLDPVMISKSGSKLISDDSIVALKKYLIPHSFLMTPNIEEAQVLLDCKISSREDVEKAAHDLANEFNINVIVKGGHAEGENCSDVLFADDKYHWFEAKRIPTKNTHGTGCTFSSAIASFLAQGFDLITSIQQAKNYLTHAIDAGRDLKLGKGCGPVHHFHGSIEK